jgi:hypothetical protein
VEQDMNVDQLIEEENLDTQNMTPPSEINKLELIYVDHGCCTVITSSSLTEKDQEGFLVVTNYLLSLLVLKLL